MLQKTLSNWIADIWTLDEMKRLFCYFRIKGIRKIERQQNEIDCWSNLSLGKNINKTDFNIIN